MGKKKQTKLPKRFLGVKLPKETRKRVNKLLKSVPASDANPIVALAVGALAAALAERLDAPLKALADEHLAFDAKSKRQARADVVKH